MNRVKLTKICNPKQWKTIPTSELQKTGYPVYGANGVIGFYSEYNHEEPVIAITCRGATCGTVNLTEPKSYITGNAMCLDSVDKSVSLKYLFYAMNALDFSSVISGSAQPQITREGLEKVEINIHTENEQGKIISRLDKITDLINLRKEQLSKLDELVKSRFVEMFGDPQGNPNGYAKKQLKETCRVITGNTPSRAVAEYYGDDIEWIKTDNIVEGILYPTVAIEFLSEKGMAVGRTVEKDTILMACIAGSLSSIGRVCVTDRKVAFNQQINAIESNKYNTLFLYVMLQFSKKYLIEEINMALKGILSKSKLEEKMFIVPPMDLQQQFASFVAQTDKSRSEINKSLERLELLKKSLMQKYFS